MIMLCIIICRLMKDAEKMMSRCIFLNVLRATCNQSKLNGNKKDTLDRFVEKCSSL